MAFLLIKKETIPTITLQSGDLCSNGVNCIHRHFCACGILQRHIMLSAFGSSLCCLFSKLLKWIFRLHINIQRNRFLLRWRLIDNEIEDVDKKGDCGNCSDTYHHSIAESVAVIDPARSCLATTLLPQDAGGVKNGTKDKRSRDIAWKKVLKIHEYAAVIGSNTLEGPSDDWDTYRGTALRKTSGLKQKPFLYQVRICNNRE